MMTQLHEDSAKGHLCLVDGSGFLFRAFHALPLLNRQDGTPVNAVLGFTNMLIKLLDDLHATHVAVIFDSARQSFRNELLPEYKAHRPDPPDELIPQFSLVRDATHAFKVSCLEQPGFEADDLIATYAKQAQAEGFAVTIVSSDKDMMQLVSDLVVMFDAVKNRRIGQAEVKEKFGVGPEKVVDVQALAGDATDNVPGVPGIGVKTAAQLIDTYGDLDTLLARAAEIKQPKRRQSLLDGADQARLSRQLVRLRDDVPTTVPIEQLKRQQPDPQRVLAFLMEQGFNSVIAKVRNRLMPSKTGTSDRNETHPASAPSLDSGVRRNDGGGGFDQGNACPWRPERPGDGGGDLSYELVQSTAVLRDWVTRARYAGVVAIDTETTSVHASHAALVGVALCVKPGQACYIPLAHQPPPLQQEPLRQIPFDDAFDILRPLLADSSVLKIGHNLKYDMVVLRRYHLAISPVDDTMLMSYVLDGGRHGHGLNELAPRHLGHQTITFKDVAGTGKSQVTFDLVPLEQALRYAAEDADITFQLHQVFKPRLATEHMMAPYETLERPLMAVLADMETEGIAVERAKLKALSQEFAARQDALEQAIYKSVGHTFNIGSPKQLGEILFDELQLEGGQKGKSGAYVTGADVLETLAAEGHTLPANVLEWRQLDKLKSTYTDALVEQINPRTGRVHTSFAMAAAATGRLSSTHPNLQNIPIRTEDGRKIRHAFVSSPGRMLLSLDYSQIELRLFAHIADIETLKQAFRAGQDIHAITASHLFGVAADKLDPAMRRRAKAINFGMIYGISAFGLARQLNLPQEEAAKYMKAYFAQYPGIQAYMSRIKQVCRQQGYVTTLFGRRCHITGIHDKQTARRSFAERAAINAPIQGTAADLLKRAMIRVPAALERHHLRTKANMLLTVHDELLFEVDEDAVEQTGDVVRHVMESAAFPALQLSVPLTVEIGRGHSWDEAH